MVSFLKTGEHRRLENQSKYTLICGGFLRLHPLEVQRITSLSLMTQAKKYKFFFFF